VKLAVHEAWLLAGLATALLIAPLARVARVEAQTSQRPSLGSWPTTTRPSPPARRASEPIVDPVPATVPIAPIRSVQPEPPDPEPAAADADADADVSTEPTMPQDGLLSEPEPQAPVDGLDAASADTRLPDDIQTFNPTEAPAGYDPSIFSIEPEPIEDRRPERFARLDPYEPVGVRIGTFTLFPEVEFAGAYFDNLLRTSTDRRRDIALETRPAARLTSNWAVHALELGARGFASFHDDLPSEDDRAWTIDARGRLDVTRRTNIEASLSRDVAQESRGTINTRSGTSGRTDVTSDRANLALNHRFNRLSVQLRGAISDRDYSSATDDNGQFVSNDDRDATQKEAAVRATWSFKPEFGVFGEAGIDERGFRAASLSDGVKRDSSGERYRVGISFGNTGQIIRGEAAIGHLRQTFDDWRLPEITGVIVDANVAWRVTGLTSLLFTGRTDIGESTVAGSGGALTRQGGVEVRHAFRRNLVGSAGLTLARADYAGIDLIEDSVTALAGLEYFISRDVTVFGRYAHVDFSTNQAAGNYTADEVRIGVRVRR
jgi:hypothetical protein